MNEFQILSQYATPRFSVQPNGDIQTENLQYTMAPETFDPLEDIPF